jgi:hypothetical protein
VYRDYLIEVFSNKTPKEFAASSTHEEGSPLHAFTYAASPKVSLKLRRRASGVRPHRKLLSLPRVRAQVELECLIGWRKALRSVRTLTLPGKQAKNGVGSAAAASPQSRLMWLPRSRPMFSSQLQWSRMYLGVYGGVSGRHVSHHR